jgi:hypothetical protein
MLTYKEKPPVIRVGTEQILPVPHKTTSREGRKAGTTGHRVDPRATEPRMGQGRRIQ